jgi:hypothetical protein
VCRNEEKEDMKCFTVTEQITKGIIIRDEPVLRIGAEGFCSEIPLCASLQRSFEALKATGEEKLAMAKADLSTNAPLRILPERVRKTRWGKVIESDIALVHVATTSPGQLFLEANCYDEEEVKDRWGNRRVRRAYRPFPGGGVDILAIGTGANGEPNALLRMLPGSSFRIIRDTLNLPPELLVVWPGSKLRLIVPEKHRKRMRRERAQGRKG